MRHLEGLSWTEFSLYGQPPRAPRESRRRHGLVGRFMHTPQRDERREHARPPSSAHRRSAEDESPDLFGQSLRLRRAWEYSVLAASPSMSEFELYRVENGSSHAQLVLYFGNHAGFPKLDWQSSPRKSSGQGKTVDEFPYSAKKRQLEGLLTFTGLRFKGIPMTPYSSVHYFANDVGEGRWRGFYRDRPLDPSGPRRVVSLERASESNARRRASLRD